MIIQKKLLQQYFNVAEFIYLWFVYKIVKFDQSIEKVSSGEVVIIFKSGPLYSVILLFFLAVPFFHILQILLFFCFSILQILCISVGEVVIAHCYVIISTVSCLSIVVLCKVTVVKPK